MVQTIKKIHTPASYTQLKFRGIAAFIAFQNLLVLACGETPSVLWISVLSSIFISCRMTLALTASGCPV